MNFGERDIYILYSHHSIYLTKSLWMIIGLLSGKSIGSLCSKELGTDGEKTKDHTQRNQLRLNVNYK